MTRSRQIISEDYLRSLSDERLRKLFLDTRSHINRGRRKRVNTRLVEEDFCWIQLELQLRNEARYESNKRRRKLKK